MSVLAIPQSPGGGGGVALLAELTAAASSSLDFITRNAAGQSGAIFQADFDEYEFEFVNCRPATNDVGLAMRMSTNGGSTFDTSAIYSWMSLVMRAGGTGVTGAEGGATYSQLEYGSGGNVGISNVASKGGLSGFIKLFNPLSTVVEKDYVGETKYWDSEAFRLLNAIQGAYESATAVNAVRFLMTSGNIADGVIRCYGRARKS